MTKPTRIRAILLALALGLSGACTSGEKVSDEAQERLASGCGLPPAAGDTVRYGRLRTSEETGDVSGMVVSLWLDTAGRWRGDVRVATGELGRPVPLSEVAVAKDEGQINFSAGSGGDTRRFRGRISCDSIWGTEVLFGGLDSTTRSYPRMP